MDTHDRRSRILGPLLGLIAGLSMAGAAFAAEPGTWQSHQTTFDYLGITPTYSCEGLEDGLAYLLKKSGARLDGPIVTGPCSRGAGIPSTLPYAQLKFSVLTPISGAADSSAKAPTVPGIWREVTISSQGSAFALRAVDCELVEEFRDKILPLLAARDIKSNLNCVPYQDNGNLFGLSFKVFTPSGATDSGR